MKAKRQSLDDSVFDFLTTRPGQWVKADSLMLIGGRCAWRTRVSTARKQLQAAGLGTITNRQEPMRDQEGRVVYKVSWYRFEPHIAQAPDQAGRLF